MFTFRVSILRKNYMIVNHDSQYGIPLPRSRANETSTCVRAYVAVRRATHAMHVLAARRRIYVSICVPPRYRARITFRFLPRIPSLY